MKKSKIRVIDFEREKKAYKAQFCCEEFRELYEGYGAPLEFNEDENVWEIELAHWRSGKSYPEWRVLKYCFLCGKKPELKEPTPLQFIHETLNK